MADVPESRPLILIGASTRAAAQSARRAGFEPFCVDQFADEDLRACATVLPCDRFPDDLLRTLDSAPQAEWLYTGGLENHPALVEQLSVLRPLLGNDRQSLQLVRDPFWLADVLRTHALPVLAVARPSVERFNNARAARQCSSAPLLADAATASQPCDAATHEAFGTELSDCERWLLKPLCSAGGKGIAFFEDSAEIDIERLATTHYLQQFIHGTPISGLFLSDGQQTHCCGLALQIIGDEASAAPPFGYSGSIAPLSESDVSAAVFARVAQIGELIARRASLRGLFGIDFIWAAERDDVLLLEVNPRYTASIELFERATGAALLCRHRAACIGEPATECCTPLPRSSSYCGKLVLYATTDIIAPDLRGRADVADVPTPGSLIPSGLPVCTVFGSGSSTAECLAELHRAAATVRERLKGGE